MIAIMLIVIMMLLYLAATTWKRYVVRSYGVPWIGFLSAKSTWPFFNNFFDFGCKDCLAHVKGMCLQEKEKTKYIGV